MLAAPSLEVIALADADPAPRPQRRRPRFRLAEVQAVTRRAPRLVLVTLAGDDLDGFETPAPAQHMKVLIPPPGTRAPAVPTRGPDGLEWPEDQPRPAVRTYTPRRWDPEARTLEIEFVLHGAGPASAWAEQAQVGDGLAVAGPGGRVSLDFEADRYVLAGDETAIPAIGTLLEGLPPTATIDAYIEIGDKDDEVDLPAPAGSTVTWLPRRVPDAWGSELEAAVATADIPAGTQVWVACEAVAVRRIRRHLLAERGLPVTAVVTRGYWRQGEVDHPDHDYGDDS
jgi:NADPH-dependent ferric siderophore reductase